MESRHLRWDERNLRRPGQATIDAEASLLLDERLR
jgi:hypothetical protein